MSDDNQNHIATLQEMLVSQINARRKVVSEWRENSNDIVTIEKVAAHQRRIDALKAAIAHEREIASQSSKSAKVQVSI